MAITNQQNTNFVQILYPKQAVPGVAGADAVPSNSATDEGGLLRAATDGDLQAVMKVAGGEGGPDFICTAVTTAADTVTFLIPWASLLKLYATQQAGVTFFTIKVKVFVSAAAVANAAYTEVLAAFSDVAGTMTLVQTATILVAATTVTAVLTNSTTNLSIAVTEVGAVAHQMRCEVYAKQAY